MDLKVICPKCEDYEEYDVVDAVLQGKLKNVDYRYRGKNAICKKCGSLLYVPEIMDSNLDSLYNEYRKQNNIVTLQTIIDMPRKYNIGKRPLSILLGWGELTYSRYIYGDIPSKKYSDRIIDLYNNPDKFDSLLEENRDVIENVTYRKCKDAVNRLLDINVDKIIDIAEYVVYKSNNDITPLAIQKLLYYMQGFYSAFFDSYIFVDDCEAWMHGPVFHNVYNKYKSFKYNAIDRNETFDTSKLNNLEVSIIDNVINAFGCYSGSTLQNFTHLEDPWLNTRNNLQENDGSNRVISKNLIKSYFKNVIKKNKINSPDEIYKYSSYMFTRINQIID